MTRAPENLLAVRQLLLTYLNVDKAAVRAADLEPGEVGIVGNAAHRGGYHCGSDRVTGDDYSVRESRRDSAGLTLDAAALDVGLFEVRTPKGVYDLPHFSAWCVAQCVAGTPDTRDIREIIWSPDGRTVRRWDRLKKRTTGDSSHRTHTHFSFHRDAIKAGRDLTPLFRRYLASIGLTSSSGGVDELFCKHGDSGPAVKLLQYRLHNCGYPVGTVDGDYGDKTAAALKAAMASLGVTDDGRTCGPEEMMRLDIIVARHYGGGQPGPQGPKGDPGPAGPAGVTMPQVLGELSRRMAS